jgi:prevent-host-death family protein
MVPVRAILAEPGRVDEPRAAKEYSDVLTQVACDHRPVIVRRNGADLAAVIPLEHLELLQDLLARREAERLASQVNWGRLVKTSPPPQAWFDGDEPKPF